MNRTAAAAILLCQLMHASVLDSSGQSTNIMYLF